MSSVTDWISAVSTAALGGAGLFLTGWQWVASGFRPRLASRIDAGREAIEITIRNRGRASGIVGRVAVVSPRCTGVAPHCADLVVRDDAIFNGFPGGKFSPIVVPGTTAVRLIIESAASEKNFPRDVRLLIDVGEARDRQVVPRHDLRVSLYGLNSVLAGSSPNAAGTRRRTWLRSGGKAITPPRPNRRRATKPRSE